MRDGTLLGASRPSFLIPHSSFRRSSPYRTYTFVPTGVFS